MRPAIIMAAGAIRLVAVLLINVTIAAVKLAMNIVQLQSGDGMTEIFLVPAAMAIVARGAELGNLPTGWVTGAATQTLMKPI